jgi:5-methylcytosine-specific restriction endonuclease McrA
VLFQSVCFYCGTPPARSLRVKHGWTDFLYNGLDRLHNAEGYTPQNVVPACYQCNVAKGTASVGEFFEWARRLSENLHARRKGDEK